MPHAKNQSRYGKRTSHTKVNRGICRIPRDTILIPLITQCIPLFDKIKICVQHIISVILLPQHSFRYGKRTSRTKTNRGICCIPREIASRHLSHKEGKRTKLVARRRSHATLVAQRGEARDTCRTKRASARNLSHEEGAMRHLSRKSSI